MSYYNNQKVIINTLAMGGIISFLESKLDIEISSSVKSITYIRGYLSDRPKQDHMLGWYGLIDVEDGDSIVIDEVVLYKMMKKFNLQFEN
jgi:hypothetical protein